MNVSYIVPSVSNFLSLIFTKWAAFYHLFIRSYWSYLFITLDKDDSWLEASHVRHQPQQYPNIYLFVSLVVRFSDYIGMQQRHFLIKMGHQHSITVYSTLWLSRSWRLTVRTTAKIRRSHSS